MDADDSAVLVERAAALAERAVVFDRSGSAEAAVYFYTQAAGALLDALRASTQLQHLESKASQYLSRAEQLSNTESTALPEKHPPDGHAELERVFFLMSQALDEDEAGNYAEAVELYGQAVELCISSNKEFPNSKFTESAEQALLRAERLKSQLVSEGVDLSSVPAPPFSLPDDGLQGDDDDDELCSPFSAPSSTPPSLPNSAATRKVPLHRGFSSGLQLSGSSSYSRQELRVLASTSRINASVYVPFMEADLRERFAFRQPYQDSAGLLPLSPKQRRQFHRWARPELICQKPCMIETVDCFSIRQTCISDCSFVASLAVSALFEKRFRKPLITSIIFPRNRANQPVYNPCGKYMVRLHVNGVPRKVVIDDLLPVDQRGRLLCSYSSNTNELWVSLLEKAYMKVMGGYDFPGSNSGIDLYALTGWIPERQSLRAAEEPFNADAVFKRLLDNHHKGNVLATVATGAMHETAAALAGLVPTHAYAVLDVREVQGRRLLLLKNPWSHLRWRGRYSELDLQRWTPALQQALHYDPRSARQFDNGVFWIDYDSLLVHFEVFYLNWNPQLFSATFCHHSTWKAGMGPVRDMYNIGDNPQYRLEVRGPTAVWVLLSRHITDIEDFRNNKEYITVIVYKTEDGQRVFHPNEPEPYIDGVRINSPHYLCKLTLRDAALYRFTLVVAQYEKVHTIHYTLRAYSAAPFQLQTLAPLPTQCSVSGEWRGKTAGGCTNHRDTYSNNPSYQLYLPSAMSVTLQLKGPRVYQVGMDVVCVDASPDATGYFKRRSSGSYKSGLAVLALGTIPRGKYNVVPTTYLPGQEGPFILSVLAAHHCTLTAIH